jgi:U11/U12 small nuclear ribonucleoprotein SNRNP65
MPYSIEQQEQAADPISATHGLLYPPNPHLRYYYPDPTPEILNNITHAIGTVPRFYTQVLHLMNKFNMPPPFGPLEKESRTSLLTKRKHNALLASDESELEGDEDDEDEISTKQQEERIKLARLTRISAEKQKLVSRQQQQQHPAPVSSTSGHKIKIIVGQQPNQEQQAIRDKCVPVSEWTQLPAFKNYEQGTPSAKLYVKNLSKEATKKELADLFSKFSKGIDISLMTKGRLRGQAFITFPNESAASLAVQCTNGYPLHNRPMAVLFGRETNTK